MSTETVVLIHGLWMTPLSWEQWIDRYGQGGSRVLAPAWPGMEDRDVADLRRDTSAFAEYPERTHFTLGQDGWEEVADRALAWAAEKTAALAVPR